MIRTYKAGSISKIFRGRALGKHLEFIRSAKEQALGRADVEAHRAPHDLFLPARDRKRIAVQFPGMLIKIAETARIFLTRDHSAVIRRFAGAQRLA